MKRYILLVILAAIGQPGCNNPKNKEIDHQTSENKTMKQDSISGYSKVNGISMYYEIHGTGEPLVLLHGGGSTIESTFGKILPMLAANFRVIAVELQSHGRTSDRESPESFEQDADDVIALLQNLNIPKASFFGFSNGGNDAIQIAVRHPEFVNKLILASTYYKREAFPPGFFEGMKNATIEVMPQPLKDAFLKVNPDTSRLLTMFTKDRDRMVNFKDWKDESMHSIKAPALVINGDHDVVSVSHAEAMAKIIPGARLMVLPATHGSYLGVAESPSSGDTLTELTIHVITEFLK